MVSRVLNEGRHAGAYIVSEAANEYRSRQAVVFGAGSKTEPGTVLKVAAGKYVPVAADGAGAVAIAFDAYDASEVDTRGVASVRDMEANGHELVWPAAMAAPAKATAIAALAAVGIIVRF